MKKISINFICTLIAFHTMAQYESTISMAKQINIGTLQGTARYVGTGGTLGSVGGDISNLTTNPAGLGMFSRTEFEFTPAIQINNTNSNYIYSQYSGTTRTDNSVNFNNNYNLFSINSLGIVIANRRSDDLPFRASNITIGLNRTADFNRVINFGVGTNNIYSYSNYLSDGAIVYSSDPNFPNSSVIPTKTDYYSLWSDYSRVLMARETGLVYYDNTAGSYNDPIPYQAGSVAQSGYKKITGGIEELSFAWSGNIKDRYYIGVSLGIPILKYQSELLFSEDNSGASNVYNSFYGNYLYSDLAETEKFSGTGVNLKIGGLVKITDQLKASAYFHTPTFYQITNSYAVGYTVKFANSNNSSSENLDDFEFKMYTPFKFGGGLSYMFGKHGFLSAEYEYNNLKSTSIDVSDNNANTAINTMLSQGQNNLHTLKIGGEYALDMFRFRAGFNYRTTPMVSSDVFDRNDRIAQTFTIGAGIRGPVVSFDIAFMKTQYKDYNYFYGVGNTQFGISTWNSANQVMGTINIRFNSKK